MQSRLSLLQTLFAFGSFFEIWANNWEIRVSIEESVLPFIFDKLDDETYRKVFYIFK